MISKNLCLMMGLLFYFSLSSGQGVSLYAQEAPFAIIQDPEGEIIPVHTYINITLINNQAEPIDTVNLYYCSLEPSFSCHFPCLQLQKNHRGHFSTVFVPEYTENTTMGYHLQVTMNNGSVYDIPDNQNYSSSLVIQQASDEKYYFTLQLVRSTEATTSTKSVGNRLIFTLEVMVLVSM
ncbi:MAG: hypothetical protein ACFFAE_21855, partial [Candidatus Hodarchaeota archaeon]